MISDKDAFDGTVINLGVMTAKNKNEGTAADFSKAAVVRVAVVVSLVVGDSILEGCCGHSFIKVGGCEVEFIPQIRGAISVNVHYVSFSYKSVVAALDASAVG
jgi:hypothetical protein